ncbi:MAG: hypothetical protein LBV03_09510 [Fusobacteriales bacterium]|jgi:hypothetical protein|nr:hypothetical protein [Fusobacteriales bacterium]
MDTYKDGNEAKIAHTSAGYYRLEEPEEVKDIFKIALGATYEIYSGFRIGTTIEQKMATTNETKYQVNLSWKF